MAFICNGCRSVLYRLNILARIIGMMYRIKVNLYIKSSSSDDDDPINILGCVNSPSEDDLSVS